jgi:hypothetical protein
MSRTAAKQVREVARPSRPRNSPGWGMLVAVRSATITDGKGRLRVEKDRSYVAPDHPLPICFPELFMPADPRNKVVAALHRSNLEAVERQLTSSAPERPAGRTRSDLYGFPSGTAERPSWRL